MRQRHLCYGCGNTSAPLCSVTSALIKPDLFTACILPVWSMSFSFKPFGSVLLVAVSVLQAFVDPVFLGNAFFIPSTVYPFRYNLNVSPKDDCSHFTFHFLFRYCQLSPRAQTLFWC